MSNQPNQADRSSGNADGGGPPPEDESRRNDQPDQQGRRSDQSRQEGRGSGGRGDQGPSAVDRMVDRFTETFVRMVVAIIGLILLLLALSQIVGIDLYSIVGAVITSRVGQWLLVAAFGLGLIVAASKRWTTVQG